MENCFTLTPKANKFVNRSHHSNDYSVYLVEKVALGCFSLFLTALLYKRLTIEYYDLGVDLTILFLGLTVLFTLPCLFFRGVKGYQHATAAGMLLLLYAMPLLYLSLADFSVEYTQTKTAGFFTATLMSSILPIYLIRNEQGLRWFLKFLLFSSAAAVIIPVTEAWATGALDTVSFRGDGFSAKVITISRVAAMCTLVAFIQLRANSLNLGKIAAIVIIAACTLSALITASRGPFFGMIFTLVLLNYRNREGLSGLFVKLVFLGVMGALAFLLAPYLTEILPEASIDKLSDQESSTRLDLWKEAYTLFITNPLGVGFAQYQQYNQTIETAITYPHNIFLEYFTEMGFPGGILFCVAILWVVITHKPNRYKSDMYTLVFVLFVYFLIQAQVSGSINGNRTLFAMMSISVIKFHVFSPDRRRRKSRKDDGWVL